MSSSIIVLPSIRKLFSKNIEVSLSDNVAPSMAVECEVMEL